jgi:DNA-binding CsgD family transcriptional regulator
MSNANLSKRAKKVSKYLVAELGFSPTEGLVFALRAEGYSLIETQRMLGVSNGASKSHSYNGFIKLKKMNFFDGGDVNIVHFVYLMAAKFPIKESKK